MRAALIILDGWGFSETQSPEHRDAVRAADTPTFDRLRETGAFGTLSAYGRDVGLPSDQMGNSEVGHVTIGAGRTVHQEYTRINDAIEAGELDSNETIAGAFDHAEAHDGRVHFAGLVSEGGVHSDQDHLYALIGAAADRGVDAVTHAFTDGRDTPPKSGAGFLTELEDTVDEHGTGEVATVSGRYYAMDRDQNWERTKRAYDAIVNREADHEATSAVEAVEASYDRGDTDEFVEPTLVDGGPAGSDSDSARSDDEPMFSDGDAVVSFNFRADRARQLVRMIANIRPENWKAKGIETNPPMVHVATMTEYDATYGLPVAFRPHQPEDTLGEVLSDAGFTQLRIAESEKYAHVTYFLNGGREVEFPGEHREIVESPDVPTYDVTPEMSAVDVTDRAIEFVTSENPDVLVLNYANPDMVGHTGDFDAAVTAVETVDRELDRLAKAVRDAGGHLLITADHGNADDMGTPDEPHTAHTFAPVPFVHVAPNEEPANGELADDETDDGRRVRADGTLSDIAPTLLELVEVEKPDAMTGESLLE